MPNRPIFCKECGSGLTWVGSIDCNLIEGGIRDIYECQNEGCNHMVEIVVKP